MTAVLLLFKDQVNAWDNAKEVLGIVLGGKGWGTEQKDSLNQRKDLKGGLMGPLGIGALVTPSRGGSGHILKMDTSFLLKKKYIFFTICISGLSVNMLSEAWQSESSVKLEAMFQLAVIGCTSPMQRGLAQNLRVI